MITLVNKEHLNDLCDNKASNRLTSDPISPIFNYNWCLKLPKHDIIYFECIHNVRISP